MKKLTSMMKWTSSAAFATVIFTSVCAAPTAFATDYCSAEMCTEYQCGAACNVTHETCESVTYNPGKNCYMQCSGNTVIVSPCKN